AADDVSRILQGEPGRLARVERRAEDHIALVVADAAEGRDVGEAGIRPRVARASRVPNNREPRSADAVAVEGENTLIADALQVDRADEKVRQVEDADISVVGTVKGVLAG